MYFLLTFCDSCHSGWSIPNLHLCLISVSEDAFQADVVVALEAVEPVAASVLDDVISCITEDIFTIELKKYWLKYEVLALIILKYCTDTAYWWKKVMSVALHYWHNI